MTDPKATPAVSLHPTDAAAYDYGRAAAYDTAATLVARLGTPEARTLAASFHTWSESAGAEHDRKLAALAGTDPARAERSCRCDQSAGPCACRR
jgi:hypothetical protein